MILENILNDHSIPENHKISSLPPPKKKIMINIFYTQESGELKISNPSDPILVHCGAAFIYADSVQFDAIRSEHLLI